MVVSFCLLTIHSILILRCKIIYELLYRENILYFIYSCTSKDKSIFDISSQTCKKGIKCTEAIRAIF